ncbi:MAG: glycosyltransferase [Deltaproteobacteria bacterium]|nr:glycosyltransferase [Deltaproteobacteria bacterium]
MLTDSDLRSFIIPVLDFSPHSPFNILTLLDDLKDIPGEVICIFNSHEVFDALQGHERIDKYCHNKLNAGVSRSWNIGMNMAEGKTMFIMNADLHVKYEAVNQLENYLYTLPKAVIVGPQGTHIDFDNLRIIRYFEKGNFSKPVQTHDVSGFFFCIHQERFIKHNLMFDVRYSPCFMEEWDMGLQVLQAGLACYAAPVIEFEHDWGISQAKENVKINYFGRDVYRDEILKENRLRFLKKWFGK